MKYFGTDGIRQPAEHFTPDFAAYIVKGLVDYAGDNIKVLVAGDTRESTEWMIADFEAALETFGIEYANAGVLPTPAINYCFYEMGFDFAIDITASHNPYTDNGVKIFERGEKSGKKLCKKGCECIEAAILEKQAYTLIPATLRENLHDEALKLYQKHLLDYLGECSFKGLKIGIDCANGAMGVIGGDIFKKLGAKVTLINSDAKYGKIINKDCGSTHLKPLQKLVHDKSLDFGIAFDGDGDRCLMISENGEEVNGDEIIAILADYLELDAVAITVMANQGLLNWLHDNKKKVEITDVGDTNVTIAMRKKSIELGGEQSGHVILPGETTGDGMLTALMMTKVVAETKKTLGELASAIVKYPQTIVNMKATPEMKENLKSDAAKRILTDFDDKVKKIFGRILVRPSGTEALVRVTVWGDDEKAVKVIAKNLKDELEKVL